MSRYLSGCDRWYSNLRWQVINDRAGGFASVATKIRQPKSIISAIRGDAANKRETS
jgi:hypothetical protein